LEIKKMERPMTGCFRSDGHSLTLKEYEAAGGYQALRKALRDLTPDEVIGIVQDAKLRGRGGAGFPTGSGALCPKAAKFPPSNI